MRYARDRAHMLKTQLESRGITDPRVLYALGELPREAFVPAGLQPQAYSDFALPIGEEQTISQPYIIAQMLQLLHLDGHEKVLEIGVGSGYQTAALSLLCARVYGMERHRSLMATARRAIESLGIGNVVLRVGDGTLGWRDYAPFDAIIVGAAGPEIPAPLLEQLAPGGILVMPVGDDKHQELRRVIHDGDALIQERHDLCRFVPLIGHYGW